MKTKNQKPKTKLKNPFEIQIEVGRNNFIKEYISLSDISEIVSYGNEPIIICLCDGTKKEITSKIDEVVEYLTQMGQQFSHNIYTSLSNNIKDAIYVENNKLEKIILIHN